MQLVIRDTKKLAEWLLKSPTALIVYSNGPDASFTFYHGDKFSHVEENDVLKLHVREEIKLQFEQNDLERLNDSRRDS